MAKSAYASNVFVNCAFDEPFKPVQDAILFAILDCGFVPRCALEINNGADIRIDKINRIIAECKFGIHDISRTELDEHNDLPRFNMPLELGIFLGAKKFGDRTQKNKNCLILDCERYRYQQFISDISGQDIQSHNGEPREAISVVRRWLNDQSGRRTIPGGAAIARRYDRFREVLPEICLEVELELYEIEYNDYILFAADWLRARDA